MAGATTLAMWTPLTCHQGNATTKHGKDLGKNAGKVRKNRGNQDGKSWFFALRGNLRVFRRVLIHQKLGIYWVDLMIWVLHPTQWHSSRTVSRPGLGWIGVGSISVKSPLAYQVHPKSSVSGHSGKSMNIPTRGGLLYGQAWARLKPKICGFKYLRKVSSIISKAPPFWGRRSLIIFRDSQIEVELRWLLYRWLKAHLEFSFDPCQSHLKPQCSWDAWSTWRIQLPHRRPPPQSCHGGG